MNETYIKFLRYFPKTVPLGDINNVFYENMIKELQFSYLKNNSIFPLKYNMNNYNKLTLNNLYILRNIFNDPLITDEAKIFEMIKMYNNWGEKQHNILLPEVNKLIVELIFIFNKQQEMINFYKIIQKQMTEKDLEDITKNISSFDKSKTIQKKPKRSPKKIIKRNKIQSKKKDILELEKLHLFGKYKIKKR